MKKYKLIYDSNWIWKQWNLIDNLEAQIKCCALDNYSNAGPIQRKQSLRTLHLLRSHVAYLLKVIDDVIACWDKK